VTGRAVDARSDLFSLGVVLHKLLTGRLPFAGENRTELFRAIVNNPAIPVDQLSDATPVALSGVVSRLLAKNREQRYQSAADVLSDLRLIGQPARSMSTARARRMTHSRWFHRVVGSAAGVVLSVGGILPATIVLSHEAEAAMRSTAATRSGVWTGIVGARAFSAIVSAASSPDSVWIGNDGTIVYDAWRSRHQLTHRK
jgi:serine/threonine protein kinase